MYILDIQLKYCTDLYHSASVGRTEATLSFNLKFPIPMKFFSDAFSVHNMNIT